MKIAEEKKNNNSISAVKIKNIGKSGDIISDISKISITAEIATKLFKELL